MCGIIGYTGRRPAAPILLEGLSSLEYRGYDSTGIAVIMPSGKPLVRKSSGKLSKLKAALQDGLPEGNIGIGHTRWATHGGPTDSNAHPHADCHEDVVVVHNGIVENYIELKRELADEGHDFTSQTDSECIPHLIESCLSTGCSLEEAVRQVAGRIRGANAVVVISRSEPGKIVAFRLGNAGGIVVGYGENEMLLASDLPALLPHTRRVMYLNGGEMAILDRDNASYTLLDGTPIEKTVTEVPYDPLSVAKGEYRHFMLKEIHEQPEMVIDTLRGRVSFDPPDVQLEELPYSDEVIGSLNRVVLVGMGTSLHGAMVGRTWMESLARIASEADNSSEFRYRDPVIDERTLVVSISQSGETADTLAAMEEATRKGARQITLCNYAGTQTTRVADGTLLIRAGLEIAVASSKAFTCSLVSLYLLAMHLGIKRNLSHPSTSEHPPLQPGTVRGVGGPLRHAFRLPLPRSRYQLPAGYGGGAKAQGDQLYPCRGLPRRRDEARPHLADRREHARGRAHTQRRVVRQDAKQHPRGQGPRRDRRGHRHRGRFGHRH